MIRFFSIIVLFLTTVHIAEANEFQIRKVSKSRTKVLIQKSPDDPIRRGSRFSIEFVDGGQCVLKALKVKGKAALLSARSCKNRKKIRKGMLITLLSGEQKKSDSSASRSSSKSHKGFPKNIGVGLHYNMANGIGIEGTDRTGSSDFDAVTSGAIGLSLEYINLTPESIGFSVGFSYELSRDIDGAIGTWTGDTVNGGFEAPIPTFGAMYLHGSANYALNSNLYFTGGLNYSLLSLDNFVYQNSNAYDISGGIGFQIGGGYFFNESMGVELLYKSLKGSMTNPTYSNVDLSASLTGIHLGFRYLFF